MSNINENKERELDDKLLLQGYIRIRFLGRLNTNYRPAFKYKTTFIDEIKKKGYIYYILENNKITTIGKLIRIVPYNEIS